MIFKFCIKDLISEAELIILKTLMVQIKKSSRYKMTLHCITNHFTQTGGKSF